MLLLLLTISVSGTNFLWLRRKAGHPFKKTKCQSLNLMLTHTTTISVICLWYYMIIR